MRSPSVRSTNPFVAEQRHPGRLAHSRANVELAGAGLSDEEYARPAESSSRSMDFDPLPCEST